MEHYELLQEYIQKMANVPSGDTEQDHIDADNLLCELLDKLGFNEVVKKYELVRKWYA